jgi:hypothetical protein
MFCSVALSPLLAVFSRLLKLKWRKEHLSANTQRPYMA